MKKFDWKPMYAILCGAASDALDLLPKEPERAAEVLREALLKAEDLYVEESEEE